MFGSRALPNAPGTIPDFNQSGNEVYQRSVLPGHLDPPPLRPIPPPQDDLVPVSQSRLSHPSQNYFSPPEQSFEPNYRHPRPQGPPRDSPDWEHYPDPRPSIPDRHPMTVDYGHHDSRPPISDRPPTTVDYGHPDSRPPIPDRHPMTVNYGHPDSRPPIPVRHPMTVDYGHPDPRPPIPDRHPMTVDYGHPDVRPPIPDRHPMTVDYGHMHQRPLGEANETFSQIDRHPSRFSEQHAPDNYDLHYNNPNVFNEDAYQQQTYDMPSNDYSSPLNAHEQRESLLNPSYMNSTNEGIQESMPNPLCDTRGRSRGRMRNSQYGGSMMQRGYGANANSEGMQNQSFEVRGQRRRGRGDFVKKRGNNLMSDNRRPAPVKVDASIPHSIAVLFRTNHCGLCDVRLNSRSQSEMHYEGKPHKKVVETKLDELKGIKPAPKPPAPKGNPLTVQTDMAVAEPDKPTDQPIKPNGGSDQPAPTGDEPSTPVDQTKSQSNKNPAKNDSDSTQPPPKKKKKNNDFVSPTDMYCKSCNISFTSTPHATQHYMGRNHHRMLHGLQPLKSGYFNEETGKWQREPIDSFTSTMQLPNGRNLTQGDNKGRFYCSMCDIATTCQEQLDQHCLGAKHKSNESKKQDIQMAVKGPRQEMEQDWPGQGMQNGPGQIRRRGKGLNGQNEGRQQMGKRGPRFGDNKMGNFQSRRKSDSILASVLKEQQWAGTPTWKSKKKQDFSINRTPSGQFYCDKCNVTVNSEVQFKQHVESRKHHTGGKPPTQ